MAILEVSRRRLNARVAPDDGKLKSIFPKMRDSTGAKYVFYSAMEEPEAFFQIGEWESMQVYNEYAVSAKNQEELQAFNNLSTVEWIEHIPIDTIATLPLQAPVMTVSRCFFKEYDGHADTYEKEVATLLPTIEAETKPWRYYGGWTVDTTPNHHKWVVMGGWRSKKHHQEFATKLKDECDFFSGMPEHYVEGTVHRHCWNMETVPDVGIFETLQGFMPQNITAVAR